MTLKMKPNPYKIAPTWLWNFQTGEKRLFSEQNEVDRAWRNGWYGPANMVQSKPLLSKSLTMDNTLKEMRAAAATDPRYRRLRLPGAGLLKTDCMERIVHYEVESGLLGAKVDTED